MIIPGFVHVAVLTFSLAGVALSGAETPARLGSMVVDWGARPVKPTDVGQRRDICEAPTPTLVRLESHVSTLNPGKTSHPPHRHPQEEVIFLREGSLEVSINGQVHHAGPGSILFFASNDLHNVTNSGIVPATYVVFQFSTPATASAPAADGTRDAHWLKSQVFDWSTTAVKATKPGERRDFFDSPTATFRHLECHATTLRPGEIPHPPHRHADEEIIVMKEGNVTVELNGVPHEAGPQSVALFASNDLHGMKNTGTTNATYYVLRVGP
ncbi:MAG TPA: cupin domain-containing protein [Candidatus Didemnitutus sp.]|nr:cupin domain-containing protein [Candidatus Didemnitutus sp.]